MASSDSNSSTVEQIQGEISLFDAWMAVERLITAVRQTIKCTGEPISNKLYNEKTGMITVNIINYEEVSGFTSRVWNKLFGRNNKMAEWRNSVFEEGHITFDAADQSYERRKIQLNTKGKEQSHVPWKLILKEMMKPSVPQESQQENVNPTTPHNKRLYDQVSEIFPNDVRIITPIGPNGAVRVILNVPGSRSNEQSRRNFRRNLPLDVTKQLVEAALRIIKDSLRTKCNLDR